MHRILKSFCARFGQIVALTLILSASQQHSALAADAPMVPGELLIKLKNGVQATAISDSFAALGLTEARRLSGSMSAVAVYQLADSSKTEAVLAQLKQNPQVEYAQPNYIFRLYEPTGGRSMRAWSDAIVANYCRPGADPLPCKNIFDGTTTPPPLQPKPADVSPAIPDPSLNQQYALNTTHAQEAWDLSRGSQDVLVAVVDSGIDYNHEDLAFNLWRNPNPSDKGDVVGLNTLTQSGLPYDDDEIHGHGTHASGIIGAVGGNGKGISGINQRVSIMALKAFSAYGYGSEESTVEAIGYAIDHGAKVISNSWEVSKKDNPTLVDVINKGKDKGVLFVVAAGNSANDNDSDATAEYPSGYHMDNLISVASVDGDDKKAESSGFGLTTVLLGAPGVNIYSTLPGTQMYGWESGTSMACPHVAGAAALVWSKHPEWNYAQVKQALADSVDPVPDLAGKTITGGRLNVYKALQVQYK
jgi:subtilisin family serine protease